VPRYNYNSPPDLGQHNFEVFNGILGLSKEEIAALMESKVIY
jgi:crotonobetainyl-CoA:carnitine CoA-transferase CaiB-like acyl-CoA transferase